MHIKSFTLCFHLNNMIRLPTTIKASGAYHLYSRVRFKKPLHSNHQNFRPVIKAPGAYQCISRNSRDPHLHNMVDLPAIIKTSRAYHPHSRARVNKSFHPKFQIFGQSSRYWERISAFQELHVVFTCTIERFSATIKASGAYQRASESSHQIILPNSIADEPNFRRLARTMHSESKSTLETQITDQPNHRRLEYNIKS